jgi:hypothetical protein
MTGAYNKNLLRPMETIHITKDVSLLPKSAKCAGRNAVFALKTPPPFPQIMSSIWQ